MHSRILSQSLVVARKVKSNQLILVWCISDCLWTCTQLVSHIVLTQSLSQDNLLFEIICRQAFKLEVVSINMWEHVICRLGQPPVGGVVCPYPYGLVVSNAMLMLHHQLTEDAKKSCRTVNLSRVLLTRATCVVLCCAKSVPGINMTTGVEVYRMIMSHWGKLFKLLV